MSAAQRSARNVRDEAETPGLVPSQPVHPVSAARRDGSRDQLVRAQPIVEWAGGKRGLLETFRPLLPSGVDRMRLVEPFAGGAALYFGSGWQAARLSDINPRLIATYIAVRDDVEAVIARLGELASRHSEAHFYRVRQRFNALDAGQVDEVAACFLYLNKTCFNGLYRENRRGEFNVPFGRYDAPRIVDASVLRAASQQLKTAELCAAPFENTLEEVRGDDFVYLDPPYVPRSSSAKFSAYAAGGFGGAAQEALRNRFCSLAGRGVHVMASNSDTPRVWELFRGWNITRVTARRSVGCSAASRANVYEVVIRSYA